MNNKIIFLGIGAVAVVTALVTMDHGYLGNATPPDELIVVADQPIPDPTPSSNEAKEVALLRADHDVGELGGLPGVSPRRPPEIQNDEFFSVDRRLRDGNLVHLEHLPQWLSSLDDAALETEAMHGNAYAMYVLATRAKHRGELANAISWFNSAAEHGAVSTLLRAGHELLQAAGAASEGRQEELLLDALTHTLTAAVFGYGTAMGQARHMSDEAPALAMSSVPCDAAFEKADSIQMARERLGLPPLAEMDRNYVRRVAMSGGLCLG